MAYSDPGAIRSRLGDPPEDQLPPSVLARAQRDADAIIDSMCAIAYAQQGGAVGSHLFAAPYPDLVVMWAERLATHFVIRSPQFSVQQAVDLQAINADYEDALTSLKAVRDRRSRIPGATMAERVNSNTQTYTPIMGLDDTENHGIDPAQLDDISARRGGS